VFGLFRDRLVVLVLVEALVGHVVVRRRVFHRTIYRSVTVTTLVFLLLLLFDTLILTGLILLDFIHKSG